MVSAHDYVVIGSASGHRGRRAQQGAEVTVLEGGEDAGETIPISIWFCGVGSPLIGAADHAEPQLNSRRFNMALGRVVGGNSSVNAMRDAVPREIRR